MSKEYECECNKCKYISKRNVKEYKLIMENGIKKVKLDIKEEYGKSCNSMLVGSAKRNLIVQKENDHWDVDYQFTFTSPKYKNEKEIQPYELKEFIKERFKKILVKNIVWRCPHLL